MFNEHPKNQIKSTMTFLLELEQLLTFDKDLKWLENGVFKSG